MPLPHQTQLQTQNNYSRYLDVTVTVALMSGGLAVESQLMGHHRVYRKRVREEVCEIEPKNTVSLGTVLPEWILV